MATSTVTPHCAVIGNPIAHSRSPEIHARFAKTLNMALRYERICCEASEFQQTVRTFFDQGGVGLNITVPFKEAALNIATQCETDAEHAGAANTLWRNAHGELCADNTDGRGLVNALKHHGIDPYAQRVLIIGAGGAAKGIYLPLQEAGAACIDIANRTVRKAEYILAQHQSHDRAMALSDTATTPYDIIINATSTGLSDSALPLPHGIIAAQHSICYDMVYGRQTPFMRWAKGGQAAQIFDGYSMLIEQARLSFQRWFQVLPPTLKHEE